MGSFNLELRVKNSVKNFLNIKLSLLIKYFDFWCRNIPFRQLPLQRNCTIKTKVWLPNNKINQKKSLNHPPYLAANVSGTFILKCFNS